MFIKLIPNSALLLAAILTFILAMAHSFLGERHIFLDWRRNSPAIPKPHRQIIWASWHVLSLLGGAIGCVLVWFAAHVEAIPTAQPTLIAMACFIALSGSLVCFATRGRHLGWIVLWVIALLMFYGVL